MNVYNVFQGFKYAGVQNSNMCWCGMTYGYYGSAPEDECNKNCKGNSEQKCGGNYRNSVYELGRQSEQSSTYSLHACFPNQ